MTQVLDHGYVKLIETWGSDERIIEAARMSTAKGFLGWGPLHAPECEKAQSAARTSGREASVCLCPEGPKAGDEKLLRYLYEHKHHTPFEMAGMVIEVQAPILVFRQWHRHRTQSYNELSARYTELPDVFYIPSEERIRQSAKGSKNRQASGKGELTCSEQFIQNEIRSVGRYAYTAYQTLLDEGVAPELARCVLPVNIYSRMRASANLRNWLHFLTLRMDEHAQWETRQYASAVEELVRDHFPRTWELLVGGRNAAKA